MKRNRKTPLSRGWSTWANLLSALLCCALVYAGLWMLEDCQWDVTPERLSELSAGSLQTLSRMREQGQEATICLVYQQSTEHTLRQQLETLAASYAKSGVVRVDTIDPVAEPGRIAPYQTSGQTISEGSAIVTCGERYELIPAREMYAYRASGGGYAVSGLNAEQKLTAALRAVTGEKSARVCFLTGHGEASLTQCSQLVQRLRQENYTVEELTLNAGEPLAPGDVVVALSPARDLTEEEYAALSAFLEAGGRLMLGCDATIDMERLPHFAQIMARYSLCFHSGIVVEDEAAADRWVNSPLYLMPAVNTECAAASAMQDGWRVITPGSRAVSGPEIPLSGYDYEAILSTSPKAYLKQTNSPAYRREDGDPIGEWTLAMCVSHAIEGTDEQTRAIFLGTLYTAVDNSLLASTYNLDLTMNMIGYLAAREDALQVPVRAAADTTLRIPSAAAVWRVLGVTLALPALCAVVGVVVLIRRRRQ